MLYGDHTATVSLYYIYLLKALPLLCDKNMTFKKNIYIYNASASFIKHYEVMKVTFYL